MSDMDDVELCRGQIAEIEDLVRTLIATYPVDVFGTPEEIERAYLLAMNPYRFDVAKFAVLRLLRGEVEELDGQEMPTAATLSRECKMAEYEREANTFDIGAEVAKAVQRDVAVDEDFADGLYETPDGHRRYWQGGRSFMLVPVDAGPPSTARETSPVGGDNVVSLRDARDVIR